MFLQVCFNLSIIISVIFNIIQGFLFACSGEAFTKRLRSKAFRAILRQEIAYFDQAKT